MQVLVWFSNESGKRTMVERVRSPKWRVYAVDGLTQEKLLIWTELSKPEVIRRWRLWNEQGTASALLIVPRPAAFGVPDNPIAHGNPHFVPATILDVNVRSIVSGVCTPTNSIADCRGRRH